MTPPDQYANLRALSEGLRQALIDAGRNVVTFRALVKAKSFETPWGLLSFRNSEPSIKLPPETDPAYVAWAREQMAHEVVEEHTETIPAQVRPSLTRTLKGDSRKVGRFRIIGDTVVDTATGEVIKWASIEPPGDPVVVLSMPEESKQAAAALVQSRLAQLAQVTSAEIEGDAA